MAHINKLLFILIFAFMSGCGAFKQYKSIETSPRVKVTIKKNTATSKFDVIIFEPDDKCDFEFMGRVMLKQDELARTIYTPPGRSYFRVSLDEAHFYSPGLKDVSFVLNEGQDYTIEYERKGVDSSGWKSKLLFSINYLKTTNNQRNPVDVDHFTVCEREKNIPNE